MSFHSYQGYGLQILSELACPELASTASAEPDVIIRFGEVCDQLDNCCHDDGFSQIKPGAYLLKLDGIAKFLVTEGREIVVQPAQACPHEVLRLYLFSQGLGALLHQRGRLILHASAVRSEAGALLFLGRSGSGKSTLASGLMNAGYQVLSEDLCAVDFPPDAPPRVFPGLAQIRLWSDTLERLGYEKRNLRQVWHKEDKYTLRLDPQGFSNPGSLHTVYLLNPAHVEAVSIEPVPPRQRFLNIMENVYRAEFVEGLGVRERLFRQVGELLRHCRVRRLTRPRDRFSVKEMMQSLKEDTAR